ncbi:SET domain-containing protein [Lentinus tigrinus ALCF2SS1-6]|uniref:SET domain-containing protein n=1 Tax=Lentinus tigrinus ALCF2SS1-6 TaxID=1328759 RepID=A0A5C2SCJ0_9APHY|nr:SET domain-containing protein [Lentinus tigrinus ALCF2SS1-6]
MSASEPHNVAVFRTWLVDNGANIHPAVRFQPVASGFNVIAGSDVPADTTVVSIPFSLAITPDIARTALKQLLKVPESAFEQWNERQLESTYIAFHWMKDPSVSEGLLKHGPYVGTLPPPTKLRTPLHFWDVELEAFQGSNLYGATLDRRRDWETEWQQCKAVIDAADTNWGAQYTWDRYLTACTYLSSRAFPSTMLSLEPSLVNTPTSHPVLLPGIDSLNHARGQPVSWVISTSETSEPSITLVIHSHTRSGSELLNNYGPKPNSEFILGYGFSLPRNPDDSIVLKIGGPSAPRPPALSSTSSSAPEADTTRRWEVGRNASGAEPVWEAVLAAVIAESAEDDDEMDEDDDDEDEPSVEDELCAADMLAEMAQSLHDRLPPFPPANATEMRPEVLLMLEHYLEGQRDILQALVAFAREKEAAAMEKAREQGLDVVNEEEDEE